MTAPVFIDSNIWVYYYATTSDSKAERARALIGENFMSLIISTQTLGELYYVLTRKRIVSQPDARQIIANLVSEFAVVAIQSSHVSRAVEINGRYGYSYWDSLIIATALQSECGILYSEDMQHDQMIEHRLRIVNPFLV